MRVDAGSVVGRHGAKIVWLLIVVFVGLFSTVAIKIHDIFGTSAYDMGVYGQAFWLESHFLPNFNTIRGLHTFGDHVSLVNYLFLPLNLLHFSIHWALLGQVVSVGAGAYYCHKIAGYFLPARPFLSLALTVSYLLNPLVHNTLLWQYHEVVMASGIYLFFIYSYLQKHFTRFVIATLLLLLCREDMSLTLLSFVPLPLLQRQRRYALFLAVTASLHWWFSFKVALPYFNGMGYFRDVYGPVASAKYNLAHPEIVIARLLSQDSLFYLFLVFVPLACLPLFSPFHLLAALPALAFNILVGGYYDQPFYHYSVNIMPFLYLAASRTLSRWLFSESNFIRWKEWGGSGLLLGLALFFYAHHSLFSLSQWQTHWQDWQKMAPVREDVERIDQMIGPNGGVAASDFLLPHLIQRTDIYLFPNPWKVHYWGINGELPHHPNRVEWIVVAPDFCTGQHRTLLEYLLAEGYFTLVQSHDHFLLYHRQKREKESRAEAVADFNTWQALLSH